MCRSKAHALLNYKLRSAHTGGGNSRVKQYMFENTLFLWCERTPSRLPVEASELSFVLQPRLTPGVLLDKGNGVPLHDHAEVY
ncbi:hypothetical protein PoB_007481100 [Plakobranchus ocellatus]|uniref:Uncharacterized protein n=1 Tax=Plakobranchus ocellatus TaxID=259542 RepID=A0AAV4DVZ4_9GAST|nr:hypothetical protein PoB_007481100 [Plakobranchus ocellatus]